MGKNKIVMIVPAVAWILMLAVLAAISSTNQAFAANRTELTLSEVQASEFATYNNLLFKIYYPSGWTVNQTGTVKQGNVTFVENGTRPPQGAAMAVNQTGTVKQGNVTSVGNATRPPQAAAMARVLWLPENMSMNSDLS